MPWSIQRRDGRFCVVKDADGEVEGCHATRVDAVKQQRALYANESRMASMYDELDSVTEEWVEPEPAAQVPAVPQNGVLSPLASELVGMLLKDEREKSLIASLASSMDRIADHVGKTDEERAALVAALGQVSQPIVNVPATVVNVEPTPVTVEAPEVHVAAPEVNVAPPEVHVEAAKAPVVHVHQPRTTKTVTFERDPVTGDVSKAEVVEE